MMAVATTTILWVIMAGLALATLRHGRERLLGCARRGGGDFLRLLPMVMVGVVASGYFAALLPSEQIALWLGPDSGLLGLGLGMLAGAVTPGGPVLGFTIGATALKSGAGAPQVVAYTTAWALFAFPRALAFELPVMPARIVLLRAAVSLPLPLLAGAAAMLLGRP